MKPSPIDRSTEDEGEGTAGAKEIKFARHLHRLFTTHHSCFLGVNLMSREGNSRPLGPILITVGPSGYHDILTAEVVIDVEFLGS